MNTHIRIGTSRRSALPGVRPQGRATFTSFTQRGILPRVMDETALCFDFVDILEFLSNFLTSWPNPL